MDKERSLFTAAVVGVSIAAAMLMLQNDISYVSIFFAVCTLLAAVLSFWEWIKLERGRKLGENLFLSKFGVKPDKVKVLSTYIYKYDHLKHGISTHSVRIKFWSQEKVYKGLVDMENEDLYIREPVLFVYADDSIPVWEEVTRVHRNGMPKTVEFRDAKELLHRVNYLDKEGMLKKFSWKRYKGIEVYWNPVKQVWEP